MRLASNVCLNWKESAARKTEFEISVTEDLALHIGTSPEAEVLNRIERERILIALSNLSSEVRLLIVMRFSLGFTLREISDQTRIKLPTVAAKIAAGIKALRESLNDCEQEVKNL